MSVAKLKYFDTSAVGSFAGRGGDLRFFMLTNGMKFEEELVDWDEWGAQLKQAAVKSGESPTGHLPILYLDGQPLIETFAILRRLAKRFGSYGHDEHRDYQVDMVVDATTNFRDAWHNSVFGGPEEQQQYKATVRSQFYSLLNTLTTNCKGSPTGIVGGSPSFADATVFCLLWDDIAVHGPSEQLWKENPKLAEFYKTYLSQSQVLGWCKAARPDLCGNLEPAAAGAPN